ncbi:MAG: alkaline phosphatase family protein [Acidimicrobiia bacterium]|nr:alkaline phosphatase family protein [Acidimicrobiia bacterium]
MSERQRGTGSACEPEPVLPAYGGACIDGVVRALLERPRGAPAWLPAPAVDAPQVLLLTLDGLGWEQLRDRSRLAPTLSSMTGGPITTVAPSTTATALTSLTTGEPPARHGVVGYRVRVGGNDVLNVLRWRVPSSDARALVPPGEFQGIEPFEGTRPPVITRAEFSETGFTGAHLAGVRLYGWRMPSTLVTWARRLLAGGERFVYAYYDGIDKVAHEQGIGDAYDDELAAADRLVGDLLAVLPPSACLVVTSDHGQVDVGDRVVALDRELLGMTTLLSGEGRFRWLHARPGLESRLVEDARMLYGGQAWVRAREDAVAEGWFGGALSSDADTRLGDVVLAPFEPVAFLDPADVGEVKLRSRHGSLTSAEMLVPLVAAGA